MYLPYVQKTIVLYTKCGRNIFEKGCFSFFVENWDDFDGGENWKDAYCIIRN